MYKILFEQGDRHDATIYYVNIIKDALSCKGVNDVVVVDNIDNINSDDIVVVVNAKALVRILLKNRKQKIICWFQGIMPEEINVFYKGMSKYLRILLWTIFEYIALKKNVFSIFVSERMKMHYENKYKIKIDDNYYIMPCFNQAIDRKSFFIPQKYSKPTFLYAGTLSEWQCIDEMLSLYKEIENDIPDSKLFLFTFECEKAQLLVKKFALNHVSIQYVPFDRLNEAIRQCKYGFIIRKDIEMNRVATPTKMNSYIANGIIPIYTDCIDSFKQSLSSLQYQIKMNYPLDYKSIVNFDKKEIVAEDVYAEYKEKVFSNYYSRENHIENLRCVLYKVKLL